MDAVMFSLKRAFHRSIHAGMRLTAPFGLTPARFDLMYALVGADMGRRTTRQFRLRRLLGVSAPTVSRMVTSLERLEMLVRLRDAKGRSCGVKVTDKGRLCIAAAIHGLLERGRARRFVRAFWPKEMPRNARAAMADNLATIHSLVHSLERMRKKLYDRAYLAYPEFVSKARRELGPEGAIVASGSVPSSTPPRARFPDIVTT